MNSKTIWLMGFIENGCRIRLEGLNSIKGIANDTNDAPLEYFDLSGRRLTGKPSSGFYIRRQGGHVEKILQK